MKKNLTRMLGTILVAICLTTGSGAAIDYSVVHAKDDVQFKKELLYIISKADELYRLFQAEGMSEKLMQALLSDEDVLYVITSETRYGELGQACRLLMQENEVYHEQ